MCEIVRKRVLILVLLGFGLGAVISLWFALQLFPLGGQGKRVIVHVHAGDSISVIASELHVAGALPSPFAFRLDNLLFGTLNVQPGYYEVPTNASFSTLRAVLGGGPNATVITISPGLGLWEVKAQISANMGNAYANLFSQAVDQAVASSPFHPNGTLEGLIGPGTYVIQAGETPARLLAAMQASFQREAQLVGLTPSTTVNGLNAYQLVVGASIVEKEGYYAFNMPRVARVIVNRLAEHGSLQMDSTVLYALQRDGGRVTPAMLQTQTPYNTYLHPGLTPTPICTVSSDALNAMLHPPAGPWKYFVLVNRNGTMAFSATYAGQLANERLAASRGL